MPEKYIPSEAFTSPEKFLGEVNDLQSQVDLLKDLIVISGSLTGSILKNIFELD